jgi:hypothetical protein
MFQAAAESDQLPLFKRYLRFRFLSSGNAPALRNFQPGNLPAIYGEPLANLERPFRRSVRDLQPS